MPSRKFKRKLYQREKIKPVVHPVANRPDPTTKRRERTEATETLTRLRSTTAMAALTRR